MNSENISAAHVAERLAYDAETGVFTWKPNESGSPQWNGRFAGKATGSVDSDTGYVRIRLGSKLYYAHRLAWLLTTGDWPAGQIDHRNGVRTDNRLANLREATRAENAQNVALRKDNRAGATGVYLCRRSGRWVAEICASGKRHRMGGFGTAEEARTAYLAAKAELHRFQPTPRDGGGL